MKIDYYRKKPVVIKAIQWDGTREGLEEIEKLFPQLRTKGIYRTSGGLSWKIFTLEGSHDAFPHDWIICGIKGEFYPCKPDIFEASYQNAGYTLNGE